MEDPWAGDLAPDAIDPGSARRRRWALRPVPRSRYDYLGFAAVWWAFTWLVIIALIIWAVWIWSY